MIRMDVGHDVPDALLNLIAIERLLELAIHLFTDKLDSFHDDNQ